VNRKLRLKTVALYGELFTFNDSYNYEFQLLAAEFLVAKVCRLLRSWFFPDKKTPNLINPGTITHKIVNRQ
jgi:hypothetical protein